MEGKMGNNAGEMTGRHDLGTLLQRDGKEDLTSEKNAAPPDGPGQNNLVCKVAIFVGAILIVAPSRSMV